MITGYEEFESEGKEKDIKLPEKIPAGTKIIKNEVGHV
jgi:hypothetical protein